MRKQQKQVRFIAACMLVFGLVFPALTGCGGDKPLDQAEKGQTVYFGSYEQDGNLSNGAEPIEWLVLDRIEDRILLLSVCCLDAKAYNEEAFAPVTWETSQIRNWLNGDFYETAFTEKEQTMVEQTVNKNADQSEKKTPGGNDTADKVFLLSETDTVIYLYDEYTQDTVGRAEATLYARSRLRYTDENGMAEWWLRSPGGDEYAAQFVDCNGKAYTAGAYVDIENAVRPAVWLNAASE